MGAVEEAALVLVLVFSSPQICVVVGALEGQAISAEWGNAQSVCAAVEASSSRYRRLQVRMAALGRVICAQAHPAVPVAAIVHSF